jgi:hypothetical protein
LYIQTRVRSSLLSPLNPAKSCHAGIPVSARLRMLFLCAQQPILGLPFDPQELLQFRGIRQGAVISNMFHGDPPVVAMINTVCLNTPAK